MTAVSGLPDPCPRPETLKRRALNDRQRLLYAPMADLGGLVYDKDAVYIDIPDWKVRPLHIWSTKLMEQYHHPGSQLDLQGPERSMQRH